MDGETSRLYTGMLVILVLLLVKGIVSIFMG